jgi:hypothetical protein
LTLTPPRAHPCTGISNGSRWLPRPRRGRPVPATPIDRRASPPAHRPTRGDGSGIGEATSAPRAPRPRALRASRALRSRVRSPGTSMRDLRPARITQHQPRLRWLQVRESNRDTRFCGPLLLPLELTCDGMCPARVRYVPSPAPRRDRTPAGTHEPGPLHPKRRHRPPHGGSLSRRTEFVFRRFEAPKGRGPGGQLPTGASGEITSIRAAPRPARISS